MTHFKYASRDKIVINSKAVVCQDVELRGDITIGPGENNRHMYWTERSDSLKERLYTLKPRYLPLRVQSLSVRPAS